MKGAPGVRHTRKGCGCGSAEPAASTTCRDEGESKSSPGGA